MATTTKVGLAHVVAARTRGPRSLALQVVDAVFEAVREHLLAGDRVEIRGFGTLSVKQASARPGARNPRTGETVGVPARRKVRFKPGQALREGMRLPRPQG